eukprot:6255395-Amphidinium_carterae.5
MLLQWGCARWGCSCPDDWVECAFATCPKAAATGARFFNFTSLDCPLVRRNLKGLAQRCVGLQKAQV